ncbi:leucine-rich repeat-containing protein 71 isoform X2 [Hippoglossus stenolepis]|uniref:leucine-rich repeat-containing protein 71 isoform X2 n=1 Tax=Hippoglossus stenolepis TaxID=195615 RepID=UPI001FAF42AD|nr:leucine-rich repeat-containing protein 71 isoform X2 [Hippoglossus stenolepis]
MSRRKQVKDRTDKTSPEEEKTTGQTPSETLPAQTFDEYQCTGNVEIDFPGLCALLDLRCIPAVGTKQPASSSSTAETEGEDAMDIPSQIKDTSYWSKPRLQVELENDDPLCAKSVKVSGWKVDEQIARVLQKMLPSLSHLQSLQFWQAGLTDPVVTSLVNTASLCSSLRVVSLEGNTLPEHCFHCLLSEDSVLTHLSLRNNRMGDTSARLIGSLLSTTRTSNKNLLSLNLAFNSIGDAGAAHIAQGLRLNRALLFLSLCNNQIGDSGAAHLAAVLGDFALTHDEVVERRKMLLERSQSTSLRVNSDQTPTDQLPLVPSSTSLKEDNKGTSKKKEAPKKEEKPATSKEKSNKKSSDVKAPPSKGGKPGDREKQPSAQEVQSSTALNEQVESMEMGNPLLDESLQHRDGQLFLPGNTTLASLNLTGNRITERSLPQFLTSVGMQGEDGGLLRLCLQRNSFPPECETYVKIKEVMTLRYQRRNGCEEREEEGQGPLVV